jgi:hypothetical protein
MKSAARRLRLVNPGTARRAKRYRQRQRAEQAVFPVVADLSVIRALIVSGRLTDDGSMDREQVARKMAEVLREWAAHWE